MRIAHGFYFILLILTLQIASAETVAELKVGSHVHLALETYEPLCDGIVSKHVLDVVTIKLSKTTPECGVKGNTIIVASDNVTEISSQSSTERGATAKRVARTASGVAMIAAFRFAPPEARELLFVANGVVLPLLALHEARRHSPRVEYTLVLVCADPPGASTASPRPQEARKPATYRTLRRPVTCRKYL